MASNGGFQNSTGYSSQPNVDTDQDRTSDPASSSFFVTDFRKHDDLREMLDSSEDRKKLEAMKRIIGMVAKGKDASSLFPAVVKNVVCKNIEVKKLVYVYLTRYAEEQQDLALLSIATFQRSMKDPNQLIRASALRVLSSIRIPVIVPIMMLVIKDGVSDMSPYVRKAAAHAIPKLYGVDPEQKEELISFLEKLLADKTTLVIGSAIQAFEELCPERIDLIHKNYRKLCSLLADVEEWGQIIILNMLTRYARTQFVNPNQEGLTTDSSAQPDQPFYSSSNDSSAEEDDGKPVYMMDPDHRLLLRAAKPLLNSRNAAVIMAVVQLYYHCAPKSEVSLVSRAMIRLLRSNKEVQFVVLSTIATMALNKPGMFEPYIKSFYILANDPSHIKLLKLEILTSLATESNVSVMMREFQQYVISPEKDFAASAIQAIGKIASEINDITDSCLGGLISLLSNKSDVVVAESVVVIKKLLQMKKTGHKDIISHLTQILDGITLPNAKASILWLIGEYCDKVPKLAPDVLRKAAKNFVNAEDIVKLQTLNLASKLCITNSKQTQLLVQYVFNLARYDQSYDIRDRARFLRALILPPEENAGALAKHAKKIFLADKPAPVVESRHKERDQYQLGTLSHAINSRAHGYYELPDWPEVPPDPTVRNVLEPKTTSNTVNLKKSSKKPKKEKDFYDTSGEEESDEESEEESESENSEDEESGSEEEESGSEEEAEDSENDSELESEEDNSTEEDDSEEDSSEVAESDSDSSIDIPVKPPPTTTPNNVASAPTETPKPASQIMDLFDNDNDTVLDNKPDVTEPAAPLAPPQDEVLYNIVPTEFTPDREYELLNQMNSGGLHVTYRYTRSPHIHNEKMVELQLTFNNHSESDIRNIKITKLQESMYLHEFSEIPEMEAGSLSTAILGIDYGDALEPAVFNIETGDNSYQVKIEPDICELLRPLTMSQQNFTTQQDKLGGMNEYKTTIDYPKDSAGIKASILKLANVGTVQSDESDILLYAAQTLSGSSLVLIKIEMAKQTAITVNCDKMVVGSMLLKELKENLNISED